MSVVGTVAPMAAMAQESENELDVGNTEAAQEVITAASTAVENNQKNEANVVQVQETSLSTGDSERCDDCGSIDIERASVGTQESEIEQSNEADIETGDIDQDVDADQDVEGADIDDFVAVLLGNLEL
jgi:hypothetical protein